MRCCAVAELHDVAVAQTFAHIWRLAEIMDGLRERGLVDADGCFTDAGLASGTAREGMRMASTSKIARSALVPARIAVMVG